MFCPMCGNSLKEKTNFCQGCGADCRPYVNNQASSTQISHSLGSLDSKQQPLSFKQYIEKKCDDGSESFGTMQKRKKDDRLTCRTKSKKGKKEETVKINIGIVELEGKSLKIKRGSLLPIDVKKADSHLAVRNLGIEKQLAHNKQLRDDEDNEWILLYPDMDMVLHLPGTHEKFTVENYKEALGRPYSRVNLYICKMLDYEIGNDLIDEIVEEPLVMKEPLHVEEPAFVETQVEVEHAPMVECKTEALPVERIACATLQPVYPDIQILDPVESALQPPLELNIHEVDTSGCALQEENEPEASILTQTEAGQRERVFESVNLLIHRSTLLKDLINAFSDPNILISTLFIKVVDSNGNEEEGEGRGVSRDVLTEFWILFHQSLAVGASSKVPVIRHDYQKREWKAIGRVLLYGYCKEGIFPLGLSPAFISSCILGDDSISEELLLKSFRMYVSADEKETMDCCLQNRDNLPDNSDLMELLSSYKCYRIPNEENIQNIFCQLAHQELIQRPRYVCNCWSSILQSLKAYDHFQNAENINAFYEEMKPTSKKVVKILHASPINDAERNTFDHLKRFVKSLEGNILAFLQFTTGASVLLQGMQIEVSFTQLNGLVRRPIAHTCGPLLEIPSTYQCYNELVEEFSAILREKSAWAFNII